MAKIGYKKKRNQEIIDSAGANIRRHRKLKGLTIVKLAHLCDIEPKMLYSYEYGKVDIGISMLSFIAIQLDIKTYELLVEFDPEK